MPPAPFAALFVEPDAAHADLLAHSLATAGSKGYVVRFDQTTDLLGYVEAGQWQAERASACVVLLTMPTDAAAGLSLLSALSRQHMMRLVPVIVLVAPGQVGMAAQCYELGCNTVMIKPDEPQALAASLDMLAQFLAVMALPEIF